MLNLSGMRIRRRLRDDSGYVAVRAMMRLLSAATGFLVIVVIEHWLVGVFGTSLSIPEVLGR